MSYEAVLFDLDHTLYPYPPCNEAGKRAALETFHDLGYELSRDEFDELYADARRATKRELRGTAASHERVLYFKRALRIHADVHDAAHVSALGDAYWEGYMRAMEPFDGVEETLRDLREAGLTIGVVTNLTTRVQLEKLTRLGVDPLIDYLLTSEETGREKPSAIMFTTPLSAYDLRPSEAVMVGDDVDADVEGANAVGIDTVHFEPDREAGADDDATAGREPVDNRRPDHRIEAFGRLTDVIL